MNTVLVPTGLPAYLVHTFPPFRPQPPRRPSPSICARSRFLSAGGRKPENPARRQRDTLPPGSWPGLRTALAGSPVGAAESGSRCVMSVMSRCYGRVVHLRQLPTSCCHDAVAFGYRPVNVRPDGDLHPAMWTPSQAHECAAFTTRRRFGKAASKPPHSKTLPRKGWRLQERGAWSMGVGFGRLKTEDGRPRRSTVAATVRRRTPAAGQAKRRAG
jgi:hypothetical protein